MQTPEKRMRPQNHSPIRKKLKETNPILLEGVKRKLNFDEPQFLNLRDSVFRDISNQIGSQKREPRSRILRI